LCFYEQGSKDKKKVCKRGNRCLVELGKHNDIYIYIYIHIYNMFSQLYTHTRVCNLLITMFIKVSVVFISLSNNVAIRATALWTVTRNEGRCTKRLGRYGSNPPIQ
jgi:hypothetical protein